MKKSVLVFAFFLSFCWLGAGCGPTRPADSASDGSSFGQSSFSSVSSPSSDSSSVSSSSSDPTSAPDSSASSDSDSSSQSSSGSSEPVPKPEHAKVVLMAGQSNMLGCTFAEYLTPQSIGGERYEKVSGKFEGVRILLETGNSLDDFVPVELGQGNKAVMDGVYHKCFGPEVGMAEYLSEAFPDETIYLIKFAVGGSSLKEGWTSESRPPVNYNYQYFKNVANSGLKILSAAGLAPKIVGLCWMQGEADAESTREAWSLEYGENLAALVSDLRMNFNAYAWTEHTLNFIDAYISNSPDWTFYKNVNAAKLSFSKKSAHNYLLDTLAPDLVEKGRNGLIFDREATTLTPVDVKHYDSSSMLKLGNMFVEAVAELCRTP